MGELESALAREIRSRTDDRQREIPKEPSDMAALLGFASILGDVQAANEPAAGQKIKEDRQGKTRGEEKRAMELK